MTARPRKAKLAETHVRLYAHELKCPAYRALSTDARALLVEFRALFSGGENRVFLSVRQMMERLGIGQRKAQHARDELLVCGWIRELEKGAFHRKTKAATVYALTNEPLTAADGVTAPKDFMRWQPEGKSTVAVSATHGSRHGYSAGQKITSKAGNGSRHSYRKRASDASMVAATATQISYQQERSERASPVVLVESVSGCREPGTAP